MGKNLQDIKQLASRYWQGFISTLTGILAFIKIYYDYSEGSSLVKIIVTFGVASFVLIIIRFPKVAFLLTRWVLGKPELPPDLKIFRGPRPYYEGDALPGRNAELAEFWQMFQASSFFILQGESGSGKTSFINASLKPKISEKFRVIECRIVDEPFKRLSTAFLQNRSITSNELQSQAETLLEAISSAQSNYSSTVDKADTNKQLVLIIDQSEELFVTVKDDIRIELIDSLKQAISKGQLRVIFSIRNDFSDLLLTLCRNSDPKQQVFNLGNFFELSPFPEKKGKQVLDAMLEPLHEGDPLRKQQLEIFANQLVIELLRPPRDKRIYQGDQKSILPVELQITGMMIEFIGIQKVIDRGIENFGGKIELLRLYVESAKTYVWRKTGVDGDKSLLILRQLVSPARTKWPQTPTQIAKNIHFSTEQIKNVLDAFAEQYLVKLLPSIIEPENTRAEETESELRQYDLIHEHLVRVLVEAPQQILQKARDAEERLQFWNKRTESEFTTGKSTLNKSIAERIKQSFAQPIPISETISLWPFATASEDKRMLRKNINGYIAKLLVAIFPLIILAVGVYYWRSTDSYLIKTIVSSAPSDLFVRSEDDEDLEIILEWTKALAVAGYEKEAFTVIEKIKDDIDKSRCFSEVGIELATANKISSADSAFVRATRVYGGYWRSTYGEIISMIAEPIAEIGKERNLYNQILSIKNTEFKMRSLTFYMDALFEMNRSSEGREIFNDIIFQSTSEKSDWNQEIQFDAVSKALTANQRECVHSGVRVILDDKSIYPSYNGGQQLIKLCKDLIDRNYQLEAFLIWKKVLSYGSNRWDWSTSNACIINIITESKKSGRLSEYLEVISANMRNDRSHTDKSFIFSVAAGLLIEDINNDVTQLFLNQMSEGETFYAYANAIEYLVTSGRDSDAEYLVNRMSKNSILYKSICPLDSANAEYVEKTYMFLEMVQKLGKYDLALKMSINLNCLDANTSNMHSYTSPIASVLINSALKTNFDSIRTNIRLIRDLSERDYTLALIANQFITSGNFNKANELIKEVVINTNTNYPTQSFFKRHKQEWSDRKYPISLIAIEAAQNKRIFMAEYLCSDLPEDLRNSTLSEIARRLARLHETDSIDFIIDKINSPNIKSSALASAIRELTNSDDYYDPNLDSDIDPEQIEKARVLATKIENQDNISNARASLAKDAARKNNFRIASETATLCIPKDKLAVYTEILKRYAYRNESGNTQ